MSALFGEYQTKEAALSSAEKLRQDMWSFSSTSQTYARTGDQDSAAKSQELENDVNDDASVQSATEAALRTIDSIARVTMDAREIAVSISAAVEQQSEVTQQIASSAVQAATGVEGIACNIECVRTTATSSSGATQEMLMAAQDLSG